MASVHRARALVRPLLPLIPIVAVFALVLGVVAAGRTRENATTAAPSRGILTGQRHLALASEGIGCPTGVAFSPDGSRVALVGAADGGGCGSPDDAPRPHVLVLLRVADWSVHTRISLEAALVGKRAAEDGDIADARFASLGWSPDGTVVALAYTVFGAGKDGASGDLIDAGLLRIWPDGNGNGAAPVMRVSRGDSGFYTPPGDAGHALARFPLWNAVTGTQVTSPAVAPALTYGWGAQSSVSAVDPISGAVTDLPRTAGARYPVGSPVGPTWTLWQPGVLLGPGVAGVAPDRAVFASEYPAWSPDGRIATTFAQAVALAAPNHADRLLAPVGLQFPAPDGPIPARDPALSALLSDLGAEGWAIVAWSPDGSHLASVPCDAAHRGGAVHVQVRDAHSGQLVGEGVLSGGVTNPVGPCVAATDAAQAGAYAAPRMTARWSPDGQTLLITDTATASLTVYRLASAPAGPTGATAG